MAETQPSDHQAPVASRWVRFRREHRPSWAHPSCSYRVDAVNADGTVTLVSFSRSGEPVLRFKSVAPVGLEVTRAPRWAREREG